LQARVENLACITKLSKALGVSPGHVSQHGTKDKIGVTCQRMAVRGVMPDALRGVSLPGLTIGKIERVALSQPLRLGDLQGNRFKVTID
jgi:tRNA(Glu) U13 pseudouridine synthase TruD